MHTHKWFAFQQRSVFEQVEGESTDIHRMVDYIYMTCNCGAAIKSRVKKVEISDEDIH